eukprot:12130675-Alexandrium_andersonii.AAC.1
MWERPWPQQACRDEMSLSRAQNRRKSAIPRFLLRVSADSERGTRTFRSACSLFHMELRVTSRV